MVSSIENDLIFVWLVDGTLTGTTTPGQREPRNNGNEGVLHIPEGFRAGASLLDD